MLGYIKLHRSLLDWEWYNDSVVKDVFLHLLLSANHKDNKYKGIEIKKGQLLTGRLKLASDLNLTEMQIRTALKKLKSTNEITIKTTSKYSIISIKNWDKYQQDNQQNNQQITNKQPTNNQQITTNNNEKNDKNDKNERIYSARSQNFEFLNPDLMFDENVNKVFELYKKYCSDLIPVHFEIRDIAFRQNIKDFLVLVDFDFSYFANLCKKANKQVYLLENKIDIKSLIKNHSRIYSGFFDANKKEKTQSKLTTSDIMAKVRARKEANNDT